MPHFISLLKRQFRENSRRPALIYRGETLTFAQLETKAETAAAFLREKGLKKGDVAILYTPAKRDFLLLHLGIILAGGVSLPLNFNFTPPEMIYFLNDSGARFVFASGKQAAVIKGIKDRCPQCEKVFEDQEIRERHGKKFKEVDAAADDDCFMLYSSGTTGQPKGVVHTHGNMAAALLALQKCWAFSPDDVLLNVLPLFHIHGLSFASHLSLISGSAMILEDRFHPQQTLERINDATVFMGVPTYYYAFLNRPEFRERAAHWQCTRLFTCGSAPIRSDVLSDIEGTIGKPLINRYGMTESHVISSLPLEGPFKRGSVGLPLEGIHMKIEKSEPSRGNDGPAVGEVKIKSRNLFNRYWNKPGATRAAIDGEGFFCSGDLGYLDEQGYLFLVGRKHDLIITGGYNVYPLVVERVINQFPGVRESAVIGVPDVIRGERVMAVVVSGYGEALDIEALKRYCRERLVNYQCPVTFEVVEALPRNAMGKVLKRELKEKFYLFHTD